MMELLSSSASNTNLRCYTEGGGGGGGGGFGSYGANGLHVRAALGDVCVGYAGEARRLLQVPTSAQGDAEALANDFDNLAKRLIG